MTCQYWRIWERHAKILWVGLICGPQFTFYVIFDTKQYVSKESQTISSDDYVNLVVMTYLLMPAKVWSAGTLSQNPQKAVFTYIYFLTNFTELSNVQDNSWYGQIHRGQPNKFWVGHGKPGPPCSAPCCDAFAKRDRPILFARLYTQFE